MARVSLRGAGLRRKTARVRKQPIRDYVTIERLALSSADPTKKGAGPDETSRMDSGASRSGDVLSAVVSAASGAVDEAIRAEGQRSASSAARSRGLWLC